MDNNNVKTLSTTHDSRSTIHFPKGMSLMEVLASMFVICIGLLGVLAVIPYGAYQTAKAKNAENTSWILDAAVKELDVTGMARPENWVQIKLPVKLPDGTTDETLIFDPTSTPKKLNCSHFFMVDPFNDVDSSFDHIYRIGATFINQQLLRDRMTGQDDLVYTTHSDKRTDFSGQNNKVLSSGQYTWFFMFRPEIVGSPGNINAVPWTGDFHVDNQADVDILACYNRVPGTEQTVPFTSFVSYYSDSISVTISSGDYDFKNTKYVFLSWTVGTEPNTYAEGNWYKVINVTEPDPVTFTRNVFLIFHGRTARTPVFNNLQMLIIPGVMYHKQVRVTIK